MHPDTPPGLHILRYRAGDQVPGWLLSDGGGKFKVTFGVDVRVRVELGACSVEPENYAGKKFMVLIRPARRLTSWALTDIIAGCNTTWDSRDMVLFQIVT